jgi:hypothetical protein
MKISVQQPQKSLLSSNNIPNVEPINKENEFHLDISNIPNEEPINIVNKEHNRETNLINFEINTDDSIIDINTNSPTHEFSIATLDRKLKRLKEIKTLHKSPKLPDRTLYYSNQSPDKSSSSLVNMNPIKLINEHLKEIQLRIIGHTRAATIYENRDKFFGYPLTIISSFTSSTILMTISMDCENNLKNNLIKYSSFGMSIISLFMSVSRNFLEYSKKHQSHDLSSKLYTTLLRSIEIRLISLNKEYTKRSLFKELVDQMSIIEQYERPIPQYIDQKVRSENQEMVKKRSI